MEKIHQKSTQTLFDKQFISKEQHEQIITYRSLNIFSLNAELKIFLYLSVLLFTSGIAVLIYQNIDTIGHSIVISLISIITFVCYYFSFKKAPLFQKSQTHFESPIMEYIVLAANLLTCILIGYLQLQYNTFGTNYGLATIIPTSIGLFCGYYFDNKNVLSLAITGLAAYIGLTVSPQSLLQNEFYNTDFLSYAAIGLGAILILWNYYCSKIKLKSHFALVFLTFALHLISISCLNNIIDSTYFLLFSAILGITTNYFYHFSYKLKSISLFIFSVLYAFVGLNISLFKIVDYFDIGDMLEFILVLSPFYSIGAIILFIKMIKNFNSEIKK
ncbi:Predicted membrane protein [Flavobacterium segetis]|uniref:Predicted membrane protein n=1 Tax=Flavobacterium segetis TaxID=271157 RepID=A0A1M5IX42_9FLAO|nr:DUF2157 domain-containing protein [Flavobacterium segetis]SHG32609.1 Predicted membrane protein [Flavobacterium segetis]